MPPIIIFLQKRGSYYFFFEDFYKVGIWVSQLECPVLILARNGNDTKYLLYIIILIFFFLNLIGKALSSGGKWVKGGFEFQNSNE